MQNGLLIFQISKQISIWLIHIGLVANSYRTFTVYRVPCTMLNTLCAFYSKASHHYEVDGFIIPICR